MLGCSQFSDLVGLVIVALSLESVPVTDLLRDVLGGVKMGNPWRGC